MTVVIPGMNLDHDRVEIRPRNVRILQWYNFDHNNKREFVLTTTYLLNGINSSRAVIQNKIFLRVGLTRTQNSNSC